MLVEAAMTDAESARALEVGIMLAAEAKKKGHSLLAVGEMGIGNTTAASAITAVLTGTPAAQVTGKGTGLDNSAQAHKQQVIESGG